MKYALFSLFSFMFFSQAFALGGAGLTYQGRLLKPDGTPVTSSSVQFRIQIRTETPSSCLMYEETQVKDLSGSFGSFAITVNDGSATDPNSEPYSLEDVFRNVGSIAFPAGKCTGSANVTLSSTSSRQIYVSFNDGSFSGWEPLPPQTINFVPMALDTVHFQGRAPLNFFRVETAGAPENMGAWSVANYTKLTDLVANTTISGGNASIGGNAAGFTGSLAGDVTGGQATTTVEKIQGRDVLNTPPANGQVLTWNHANLRWEPTNLPAAGNPAWNDITGKPTEFAPGGNATGDLTGTYPNPSIATSAVSGDKIADGGVAFSKIAAGSATGQVLQYEVGVGWKAGKLLYTDLIKSGGGSPWPTTPCTAGMAVIWQSATDGFECAPISITEADPLVKDFAKNDPSTDFDTTGGILALKTVPITRGGTGAVSQQAAINNLLPSQGSNSGKILQTDGTNVSWVNAPATGITSINGATGSSQTFQTAQSNTAPTFTRTGDVHTLNIPQASTNGVTAGTISYTDYQAFSGKQSALGFVPLDPANNLSELTATAATARTNLGLGTAATKAYGTAVGNLVEVGVGGKIPASLLPDQSGPYFTQGGNAFGAPAVLGTTEAQPLHLQTGGTNKLTILNNGSVGIGTDAPTSPLHVAIDEDALKGVLIENTSSGSSAGPMFEFANDIGSRGLFFVGSSNHPAPYGDRFTIENIGGNAAGISFMASGASGDIRLYTGGDSAGNERLRIDAAGNVGIGKTNPQSKLDVSGTIRANEICDETGGNCKDISSGWGAGGDIDGIVTNSGSGLSGGTASGTATLSLVTDGSTLEVNGSNQLQVKDSGITDAKIASLAVNKITSSAGLYLTYAPNGAACAPGQVLKWNNSRWECGADNAGSTSPLTTKGDIYIRNGTVDTRLPAGADGKVLKADSAQGTGLIWGDAIATDISSLATTGIVQRNGAGSYSTVTVASPLTYTGGTLGLDTTAIGDVKLDGNTVSSTMTVGTNSAHDLALETGGTTKMTVLQNGNVGIGTTSPTSKLHVHGVIKITDTFSGVGKTIGANGSMLEIKNNDNGAMVFTNLTGFGFNFNQGVASRLAIDSAGDVNVSGRLGVGTAPQNKLHVRSDGAFQMRLQNGSLGGGFWNIGQADNVFGSGGGKLLFVPDSNDSTTAAVAFTNSGNVGIGTTTPSRNLEVSAADANTGIRVVNTTSSTTRGPNISIRNYVNGNSGSPYLEFLNSGGTQASPAPVVSNQSLGTIGFNGGYDTSGGYGGGASIDGEAAGAFTSTSTPGRIVFKTTPVGSTSESERMRIDSNGNVGIGVTGPTVKLDVAGTVKATAFEGPMTSAVVGAGAGSGNSPSITFSGDLDTGFYNTSSNNTIGVAVGGANIFNFTANGLASPTTGGAAVKTGNGNAATPTFSFKDDEDTGWFRPAADTLAASTGGTEKIRITSAGNVGIGTASPGTNLEVSSASDTKLRVTSTGGASYPVVEVQNYGTGVPEFLLKNSNGTQGSPSASVNGDWLGTIGFVGRKPAGEAADGTGIGNAGILAETTGAFTNTSHPTSLSFFTTASGVSASTRRMTISSSGDVGIGTPSPDERLDVKGDEDTWIRVVNKASTSGQNMGFQAVNYMNGQTNGPSFWGTNFRGTEATPAPVQSGDMLLSVGASGGRDSSWNGNAGAFLKINATETFSATTGGSNMSFYTVANGTTTAVQRLKLEHNGNVGIGTTNPTAYLDVNGSASATNSLRLRSGGAANLPTDSNQILFSYNGTSQYTHAIKSRHSSGTVSKNALDFYLWDFNTDAAGDIGTKHVMTLDGTGNVGIGTTNPATKLQVKGGSVSNDTSYVLTQNNAASNAFDAVKLEPYVWNSTAGAESSGLSLGVKLAGADNWIVDFSDSIFTWVPIQARANWTYFERAGNDDFGPFLYGLKSRGTYNSRAAVLSGDNLLNIVGRGYYNASSFNNSSRISFVASQNFTNTAAGGSIYFATAANNSTTVTDRMVIDNAGNVGIGVMNPSHILQINGQGRATNTAWAISSDRRLKDVQGQYQYGLNELLKMNTVWFRYKKDNPLGLPSDKVFPGVVAQEMKEIIPEAVHMESDGYYTLNVDPIHWATVNAVKELHGLCQMSQDQLSSLAAKNAEQDRRLASLEAENEQLKRRDQARESEINDLKARLERIEKALQSK